MGSFVCLRCGRCCKEIGIPWSELDPEAVAEYLNMDLHEFLGLYGFSVNSATGQIEPTEYGVTPCPFLGYDGQKTLCKIYPVRPWVCKGYPGEAMVCRGGQSRRT